MSLHIKRDDQVVVLSGEDKGKKGKVIGVDHKNGTVIVEGVNMVKKHQKARRQTEVSGIVEKEAAMPASKVMHICDKCHKPTRIAYKVLESGEKVRVCKKCGETLSNAVGRRK